MKWSPEIHAAPPRPQPLIWEQLPFGRVFSRHLAVARYEEGTWHRPRIQPMAELPLHPGTSALHYGQALFEGLKAYIRPDGTRFAFRVKDHWQRLNHSAERLAMPPVPYELFMEMLLTLFRMEEDLSPPDLSYALYIRPVYFATDPWLGVRPSESYLLLIYLTPVGPYYTGKVRAYVETEMSRAAPGGTGHIKMAGNYAGALLSGKKAQQVGCQVSLWLDAQHREYIEEFSTMNVFVVMKGPRLITPPLKRGTILPGITRDTVIYLAQTLGIAVEEQEISIYELIEGIVHGKVREVFGTGTAATITPLQALHHEGKLWELPPTHPIAEELLKAYREVLRGQQKPAQSDWIWPI
ncbi:MAG: branched-chain amino acid aminotransferase [Bacteroidia bacterium]|nr:branched-chain amino acid aminotransferase [Bacteroidia bacterium]MDW8014763.1 branched-chain amino acid aminotransferase [Bacteroidia bacterium]